MYDAITVMNVHNNLITNNTSPYGKEIFISWKNTPLLYTKFNNNDWGDEDPNDSSIIDPDNVTSRSKVTSTIKSNLLKTLNLGLLTKYTDLIKGYFPEGYLDNIKNDLDDVKNNVNIDDGGNKTENQKHSEYRTGLTHIKPSEVKNPQNSAKTPIVFNNQKISSIPSANYSSSVNTDSNNDMILGNSTSLGDDNKAYELNETKGSSVAKQINTDFKYFIAIVVIVLILLAIGYKRNRRLE